MTLIAATVCLSLHAFAVVGVYFSLSVCLSVCLSVSMSVCSSLSLFVCLPAFISIYVYIVFLNKKLLFIIFPQMLVTISQ